jgi:diguanylate cyclase (GGDEF)-like protein
MTGGVFLGRDSPDDEVRQGRFLGFAACTAALATASAAASTWTSGWHIGVPSKFWLLAFFVLAGEMFPIPVPSRRGLDKVTISTAFAFGLLLLDGVLPACAVYAAAAVLADLSARVAPTKLAFNAAQYVLSLAGAGAVLSLVGAPAPTDLDAGALPGVMLAGVTCFAINHVLAGTGAALLAGLSVIPYLCEDIGFQAWTGGCIVALAPELVASANANLALVPVAFVPMLAIYVGGRQATINAHRKGHDVLTELPNRNLLVERLSAMVQFAARASSRVTLLIVDLDDFRAVNDTLGHEFGDRVLRLVASRLVDAVGPRALLARLGGDEFGVLLESGPDQTDAMPWAQGLLDALEAPFHLDSMLFEVGASVGVASYPEHGLTADELLRHADVALYCAKSEHSAFAVYAADQDDYSPARLALAAQLRRGIEVGEVLVHYQPKVPLHGGLPVGLEALVRWDHPQLGRIGPDGFIPLAEHTGLIKALTINVLETTLRQCAAWRADGLDVRFAVNVSARSLLDRELAATVRELLGYFTVPPDSLQLEITESRIVTDVAGARLVLDELKAVGVTIAIDDFGTGFASLSQLRELPIDEIKIDRSFVIGMETDQNDAAMVTSIIELGRSLGLHVTAEGVETASVQAMLRDLGCDYAQGYHIGKPASAGECRQILDALPSTR